MARVPVLHHGAQPTSGLHGHSQLYISHWKSIWPRAPEPPCVLLYLTLWGKSSQLFFPLCYTMGEVCSSLSSFTVFPMLNYQCHPPLQQFPTSQQLCFNTLVPIASYKLHMHTFMGSDHYINWALNFEQPLPLPACEGISPCSRYWHNPITHVFPLMSKFRLQERCQTLCQQREKSFLVAETQEKQQ